MYTGTNWTTGGGSLVQAPLDQQWLQVIYGLIMMLTQMYFFDGTDLELAGPHLQCIPRTFGPEVVTVLDITGTSRTIVKYWVGGTSVGFWSKIAFTPRTLTLFQLL